MVLMMRDKEIMEESMESPCYIIQSCHLGFDRADNKKNKIINFVLGYGG